MRCYSVKNPMDMGISIGPGGGRVSNRSEFSKRGDPSHLQYAVLGLWSAQSVGLEVLNQSMVDAVKYVRAN